jgi:septal ring factor EnvC (AmiA/AmiB activator)
MVEMYKLGRARYARLVLSATDVRRFGRATRAVSALAARDERRSRLYERRLQDLRTAIATLTEREAALTEKRARAVQARAAADRALAAQSARVREIDAQRDLNAQLTGELQEAQRRLDGTLQAVGGEPPAALPIGPFRGALPWPSEGSVHRRSDGPAAGAPRPGIEIAAAEGAAVQAVHDGRVAYAGSFDGLGNLVIIEHGGQTFTLYGHLLEFEVAQGAVVGAGQPIGRVGASPTGRHTLYFELRIAGRPVDPIPWLTRRKTVSQDAPSP